MNIFSSADSDDATHSMAPPQHRKKKHEEALMLPSKWMPSLRQLTPGARLQLEIMCQLHTNDIQPISFLSGTRGDGQEKLGPEHDSVAMSPRRPTLANPNGGAAVRPRTAGEAGRTLRHGSPSGGDGGSEPSVAECFVHGLRSPVFEKPKAFEGNDVKNGFVPDAEYHAQLVRLQALLSNKQRKVFESDEEAGKKLKVKEGRLREGELKKKLADSKKMTELDYARLLKYRADREFARLLEAERKEEEAMKRYVAVANQRADAVVLAMKVKSHRESKEINAAMAAMSEKMVINKGLKQANEDKQKEVDGLFTKVKSEKVKRRKSKKGGTFERAFGLKIGLVNREGGKIKRALSAKKYEQDKREAVAARKIENSEQRQSKIKKQKMQQQKLANEVREQKKETNDLLMQREVEINETLIRRRVFSRGGNKSPSSEEQPK